MGKMITASMMKTFVLHPDVNLYAYFKFSSNDLQMATYDEMTSGDGLFNMIESHPDNVIALFDGMIAMETDVDISVRLGNLKNICVTYANQDETPQPAPQPIIEYQLDDSTAEQIIRFTIAESLDKPEQVRVCQQYGSTGDLTPWHDLATRQVRFHQDTYEIFIPACNHEVRKLKICSPVEVTVI